MKILTKRLFDELANIKQDHCISIYIPTHRTGENQDSLLHFKNEVQKVEQELIQRGLKNRELKEYLTVCENLMENSRFWRNLADGLAVFIHSDRMLYFTLPFHFENFSMVSDHFYLLPLIPAFNENGQYFLLKLSLNNVQLYKASRDDYFEIPLGKKIPKSLNEAVGFDYEQKSLQFRTGLNQGSQGMFHGQGSGKDDEKIEKEKFFRELNDYLDEMLKGYNLPLLLAATGNNFHLYKEVNSYPHLYEDFVSGNPDDANMDKLHKESWKLINNYFIRDKEEKLNQFELMLSKDKASTELEKIFPAAINGNIDTLFIQKNTQVWGTYNENKNKINISNTRNINDICLLNTSGISVFQQQGKVFLMEKEALPGQSNGIVASAILRF